VPIAVGDPSRAATGSSSGEYGGRGESEAATSRQVRAG